MASTKNAVKALEERAAFRHFLRAVGWPDEDTLIESRDEPEPDILYRHPTDGYIAFELTRLCAEDIAETISNMNSADTPFIRTHDPTAAVVTKKFRKSYKTDYPIELFCYRTYAVTPDDLVCHSVKSVADAHEKKFRRIWVLGDKLWLYEQGTMKRISDSAIVAPSLPPE